jgi:hypothetical protein
VRKTKTYVFASGPGQDLGAPVPQNPTRIAITIQNTGANPGVMRFGAPPQGSGQDFAWSAGFLYGWDQRDTCPQEAVFLASVAATSWVIVETVDGAG